MISVHDLTFLSWPSRRVLAIQSLAELRLQSLHDGPPWSNLANQVRVVTYPSNNTLLCKMLCLLEIPFLLHLAAGYLAAWI
jgi:hypothetical protein